MAHGVDSHFLLVRVFVCYNSDKCMNSMLEIKQHYSFLIQLFEGQKSSVTMVGQGEAAHRVFCDLFGTL